MAHTHTLADLPSNVMTDDGSKGFTAPVDGQTPLNSTHLATKGYVDSHASSDASKIRSRDVSTDVPDDGSVIYWDLATSSFKYRSIGLGALGTTVDGFYPWPESDGFGNNVGGTAWDAIVSATSSGLCNTRGSTTGAGATTTKKIQIRVRVPVGFVPGSTLTWRIRGRATDLAAVTMTLDAEAYHDHELKNAGSPTDICTTAAQSVNADLLWHDYDFTISPTTAIKGGDVLLVVMTIATDDSGGGGAAWLATGGWQIVGTTGWRVGQKSLVGSSLVIN